MSSEGSRRFTDREVALVLRKASEIEETEGSTSVGGLALGDLEEIAREVGISEGAIAKAVAALDARRGARGWLGSAPRVRRAVHAIEGQLDQEAIRRLVSLIDERADQTGTVSEALGSVRWTGSDRLRSTQVTITPGGGETKLQVVEKLAPRVQRAIYLIPSAWGAMLAGPLVESSGLTGLAVAGVIVLAAVAGAAVGRLGWGVLSAKSRARVERLAADLAREAGEGSG